MKTVIAGLMFLLIGLGWSVLSLSYSMGELYMMGPGLWPTIISFGLIICGAILIIEGLINVFR